MKNFALERGLNVIQPESVNDFPVRHRILSFQPDLIVVVAFGQIIHRDYLAGPRFGAINVHGSLLPRHRGAAPASAAILAGDAETGVSVIQLVPRMDAGPILTTLPIPIGPRETARELERRLSVLGAQALRLAVSQIEAGTVVSRPQDDSLATYAPQLSKEDGAIDWALPAPYLDRFVRARTDWPGAFTFWHSPQRGPLRIVLTQVTALDKDCAPCPGTVVAAGREGIDVAAGHGVLRILQLQPAGGRAMSAREFLNGHHILPGHSMGPT